MIMAEALGAKSTVEPRCWHRRQQTCFGELRCWLAQIYPGCAESFRTHAC